MLLAWSKEIKDYYCAHYCQAVKDGHFLHHA